MKGGRGREGEEEKEREGGERKGGRGEEGREGGRGDESSINMCPTILHTSCHTSTQSLSHHHTLTHTCDACDRVMIWYDCSSNADNMPME